MDMLLIFKSITGLSFMSRDPVEADGPPVSEFVPTTNAMVQLISSKNEILVFCFLPNPHRGVHGSP